MQILTKNIKLGIIDSTILDFIRTKLLNMGALNIKSMEELKMFRAEVVNIIDDLSSDTIIKLNSHLSYAQKSVVKATGDVIFTGMGSYQTKVYALENIIYEKQDSICRGGCVVSTNGSIKLGIVGSLGGVKTEIICNNPKGKI